MIEQSAKNVHGGSPRIVNGVVTEFGFFTYNVTDISPVRAFVGLKNVDRFLNNPGQSCNCAICLGLSMSAPFA